MYWLIGSKPMVQTTNQTFPIKRNAQKIIHPRLALSRFLAKTWRVNKIAVKSFSKVFCSKAALNSRSRRSCIKLTHTQQKWYEKPMTFQQDSAGNHEAKKTWTGLQNNLLTFATFKEWNAGREIMKQKRVEPDFKTIYQHTPPLKYGPLAGLTWIRCTTNGKQF